MSDAIKHENATGNSGFEHEDLKVAGVVYSLFALLVLVVLSFFLLTGFFDFLDKRDQAQEPALNPLVTDAPEDTRHVPKDYPQSAFPNPRLEDDERGQLNGVRLKEENTLNSYGWVDQNAGVVRIPIERAMDLIAERGLPVRQSGTNGETAVAKASGKKEKQ
jgi:hypothetical protein